MIANFPHLIRVGDYIKWRGHKVSEADYLMWWKVTDIEDGTIIAVNRHGQTSRTNIEHARRLNRKALVWEIGEDRADEDPSVLDNWRAANGRTR
jgi:hypothetical protein